MLPLGLCALELRNIIECAFLPLHCSCSFTEDNHLNVQISDLKTGQVHLLKNGIAPDRLASSRGISNLIAELRTELAADQAARVQTAAGPVRQARYA